MNASNSTTEQIKAVLLVGGLGTRLRSVTSAPKPLAEVGGSPFLELLIRQLREQGIRRLVLCTGYLGDQVQHTFGGGSSLGVEIEYSREASPLGTGGAIKNAESHLADVEQFIVMNGDSFLETDFPGLMNFHTQHGGLISMAVFESDNASRFGSVEIGAAGRVTGFREKTNCEEPGMINGGIYVFNRHVFTSIPEGVSSLERDLFPSVLQQGVFAIKQSGAFIDIGTPEDYSRAQKIYDRLLGATAGD